MNRIKRFTANGTWTVPSGVFFIGVEACGGGGGATANNAGSAGSNTTVAGGTTVTGYGAQGNPIDNQVNSASILFANAPTATGRGALAASDGYGGGDNGQGAEGQTGQSGNTDSSLGAPMPVAGAGIFVSPGDTITITIGAGGSGTGTGGSGYATIFYEV